MIKASDIKIGRNGAKDTGMAMTLISLLIAIFSQNFTFTILAAILLVINMVIPIAYRPIAVIWFGLSRFLGAIISTLILAGLFFLVVTPVGVVRRLLKADPLKLKHWKKDQSSVFSERNHIFQSNDIEKPY